MARGRRRLSHSLGLAGALWLAAGGAAADPPTPPALLDAPPAPYPPAALAAGVEGVVGLLLHIDAEGHVTGAEVLQPAGYGLDEAAQAAALSFVFQPARQDGAAVACQLPYRYRFSLSPHGRTTPGLAPLDDLRAPALPGAEATAGLEEQASVSGQLWERGSRQPIREASIYLLAEDGRLLRELSADEDGRFSLPSLAPGRYTLRIAAPGFEVVSYANTLTPGEVVTLEARLRPEPGGYGLTVRGEDEPEIIKRSLSKEEVLGVPGVQGDVMRAVTNLPGVARAPLSTGLLIVRGSSPEDTRTHINGLWVPHIYHMVGATSVLNTEMIERLDFFPGAYGARYGRVNGGILDVFPSTGDPTHLSAVIDVDIFDAGAVVKGPAGEHASFAVGARRSYIDGLLDQAIPFFVDDTSNLSLQTAPRSWDYEAIYQRQLANGATVRLLGLGAGDSVAAILQDGDLPPSLAGGITADSLYHLAMASYDTKGRLRQHAVAGFMASSASGDLGPDVTGAYSQDALMGRYSIERDLGTRTQLALGGDVLASFFEARGRSFLPPVEGGESPPPGVGEIFETDIASQWVEGGVFAEWRQQLGRLVIVPGLRGDRFGGAKEWRAQPRLGATYALSTKTLLRANAGAYAQDPIPFELDERFGNPDLSVERSRQFSVGVVQSEARWRLDADVFYKQLDALVTRTGSGASVQELTTNGGEGWVYGAEVMLRVPPGGRWGGFLAYTFTRSLRRDGAGLDPRPFDFDQPHVLNATASVRLNEDWTLGGRWRLASGNPNTPYQGAIYDADTDLFIPIPGTPNAEREPAFHQLDLRADREVLFDTWRLRFYVEIQNAYNRANPETTIYNYNYSQQGLLTGLPILPAFGVTGTLDASLGR